MTGQTDFHFRVLLQKKYNTSFIKAQLICHRQPYPTYDDLMNELQRSLKGRFTLHDYKLYIYDNNHKYHVHDNESFQSAFSSLRQLTLDLFLELQPDHQTYYSSAPLIKPKVMWWHELGEHNDYFKQPRKDSGIDLDSYLVIDDKSYPSDVPSFSPHSSPSTTASSSPPSPLTQYSNPDSRVWSSRSKLSIYCCDQPVGDGTLCGQTFQRPYDLVRHQSIHLKNRPFVYCQQCNKRFTRVDALRRHERVQGHYSSKKTKPHCYQHHPYHTLNYT